MKVKVEKIDNPSQLNIESVEIHNDNNFSFKFYTYGGYIHEVNIPINQQEDETEGASDEEIAKIEDELESMFDIKDDCPVPGADSDEEN